MTYLGTTSEISDTNTSTFSFSCASPDIVEEHLLVAFVTSRKLVIGSVISPVDSGWTEVYNTAATLNSVGLYYRIHSGGSSDFAFTITGGNAQNRSMISLSAFSDAIALGTAVAVSGTGGGGAPTATNTGDTIPSGYGSFFGIVATQLAVTGTLSISGYSSGVAHTEVFEQNQEAVSGLSYNHVQAIATTSTYGATGTISCTITKTYVPTLAYWNTIFCTITPAPPAVKQRAAYSVLATTEPADWYYSDETQKATNHLPEWSKIRQLKHSNGQIFYNGIAGAGLEDIKKSIDEYARTNFTTISILDEIDVLAKAEVPTNIELTNPKRGNLLYNSSFEINTNVKEISDGWQKLGNCTREASGLEGEFAIVLAPATGPVYLWQNLDITLRTEEYYTASVWYKIDTNTLTAPAANFGIRISAYDPSAIYAFEETVFKATTGGEWTRKTFTFQPSTIMSNIRFEIIVSSDTGFDFSPYDVTIDCVQFEFGQVATSWRPDVKDTLPYITTTTYNPLFISSSRGIHFTDNLDDFWYKSIPTRAELHSQEVTSETAVTTAGDVDVTDYHKKTWKFLFEKNSNLITKRSRDIAGDVLNNYYIVVKGPTTDYYLEHYSIEAFTLFANLLWVVVNTLDYTGTNIKTIFVLDIKTPHPEPDYLVCLASIPITGISTARSITKVEFRNEDRQFLYISSSSTTYAVRLYYDLCLLDPISKTIYFRELYPQLAIA